MEGMILFLQDEVKELKEKLASKEHQKIYLVRVEHWAFDEMENAWCDSVWSTRADAESCLIHHAFGSGDHGEWCRLVDPSDDDEWLVGSVVEKTLDEWNVWGEDEED